VAASGNTHVVADYEAPNGVTVRYRARATYLSGGLPITGSWVESTPDSWTSDATFLKNVANSALNLTAEMVGRPLRQRNRRRGVHHILGRREPVVVSDVPSSGATALTFDTLSSAEAASMETLLDGSDVVLVQPGSGVDVDQFYLAVADYDERFLSDVGAIHLRRWTLNGDYVAAPADPDAAI
jgi:hypothetical protein